MMRTLYVLCVAGLVMVGILAWLGGGELRASMEPVGGAAREVAGWLSGGA